MRKWIDRKRVRSQAGRILFLTLIMGLVFGIKTSQLLAQPTFEPEVVITDGPGKEISNEIGKKTTAYLRAINEYHRRKGKKRLLTLISEEIVTARDLFALIDLEELVDTTTIIVKQEVLETRVLALADTTYEIRKLFVEVDTKGNKEADKTQELVLNFDKDINLISIRFAMNKQRYDEIMSKSNSLKDEFRRKQLVGYLERFRTAYNKKDIDYIELQFSDNALIITGTKVEVAENQKELDVPEDQKEKYIYVKRSKKEYIKRLRENIFGESTFINVEFTDINIYQHPQYEEVYGVNLFQKWSSDDYSDEGYLFLMVDYEDENKPMIYVRAWQPDTFATGELIDMDMFELVK